MRPYSKSFAPIVRPKRARGTPSLERPTDLDTSQRRGSPEVLNRKSAETFDVPRAVLFGLLREIRGGSTAWSPVSAWPLARSYGTAAKET